MEGQVGVKARYQNECRRFQINSSFTLDQLRANLIDLFDLKGIPSLKYQDEEGDDVELDSQEEFVEALKVCETTHRLRLVVDDVKPEVIPDPSPSPSEPPGPRAPSRKGSRSVAVYADLASWSKCLKNPERESTKRSESSCSTSTQSTEPAADGSPVWFAKFVAELPKLSSDVAKAVLDGLKEAGMVAERAKVADSPKVVHLNYVCDGCESSIVGVRYKCANCADYDLCESCEKKPNIHHRNHAFLKLNRPAYWCGMDKDGRRAPILPFPVYDDCHQSTLPSPHHDDCQQASAPASTAMTIGFQSASDPVLCAKAAARMEKLRLRKLQKEEQAARRRAERERRLAERASEQKPLSLKEEKKCRKLERKLQAEAKFSSKFVRDCSLPDGTKVQPSTSLVKRWRIQNNGLKAWDDDVIMRCVNGTLEPLRRFVRVAPVQPGEETDVQVEFQAPGAPGEYQSNWILMRKGVPFGHIVWCKVEVVDEKPVAASPAPSPHLYSSWFVGHVTVDDYAVVRTACKINKQWRMLNNGKQAWNGDVVLKCVHGNLPAAATSVAVPPLLPGQSGVIEAQFTAPREPGVYSSTWVMMHNEVPFGHIIWCRVNVQNGKRWQPPPRHYSSQLVDDSLQDGAKVAPGSRLSKTWTMSNNGDLPWDEGVVFKCVSGNLPADQTSLLVKTTLPGQSAQITAAFSAPHQPGIYKSTWALMHNDLPFGHIVWCEIEVTDEKQACAAMSEGDDARSDVELITWDNISQPQDETASLHGYELVSAADAAEENSPLIDPVAAAQEQAATLSDSLAAIELDARSDAGSEDYFVVPMPACFNVNVPLSTSTEAALTASTTTTSSVDLMTFSATPVCGSPLVTTPIATTPVSTSPVLAEPFTITNAPNISNASLVVIAETLGRDDEEEDEDEQFEDARAYPEVTSESGAKAEPVPDTPPPPTSLRWPPETSFFPGFSSGSPQCSQDSADARLPWQRQGSWQPQQSDWCPQQSSWQPSGRAWSPPTPTTPMERLFEMGFCQREKNQDLLKKYNNDVNAVVAELIQTEFPSC